MVGEENAEAVAAKIEEVEFDPDAAGFKRILEFDSHPLEVRKVGEADRQRKKTLEFVLYILITENFHWHLQIIYL